MVKDAGGSWLIVEHSERRQHHAETALVHGVYSAHQGVEDGDMNVLSLGGKVIGSALALELIQTFLHAQFSGAARHQRRLVKVQALETGNTQP